MRRRPWPLLGILALLATPLLAVPARADGPAWPGGTVRYAERLAPSDHWALRHAVRTWNRSGAAVRLERATPDALAGVVIGYLPAFAPSVGSASLGYSPFAPGHAQVLAPGEREATEDRYVIAMVLAHELGHVLGLGHGGECSLMAADLTAWTGATDRCRRADPDAWRCRMLAQVDARRLVALYGGAVPRMPAQRWCRRR